jgi:hypothetical protein
MSRMGQKAPSRLGGAIAALLVAGALLLAGCGSTSPASGVAHLGSTTRTTTGGSGTSAVSGSSTPGAQALKFSACMRSHGEPNFPDPEISNGGTSIRIRVTPASGIDPGSPAFQDAQRACRAFAPVESHGSVSEGPHLSAKEQAQVLKAAACMRTHGEPNLPDPTFAGGGVHLAPSVNAHSATFKAAEQACRSLIPRSLLGGG